MSTIVRSREPHGRRSPLTARAVRVRNFYVRAIARKRGLRAPADAELAGLQADATLSAAVGWWEQVQRAEGVTPRDFGVDVVSGGWSAILIKVAAIAAFVIFALVAFPGEIAGRI